MKLYIAVGILAALAITIYSAAYTVPQAAQALITQFGEIQGKPVTKAGLHFKVPFVQDVRYFDKRILSWDGDQEQIPTKDKKYIWVDTTARWRIVDAVKFAQTLQNEFSARDRLDGILDGVTRDTISSFNLVEAVRNSNGIIDNIKRKKQEQKDALKKAEGSPEAAKILLETVEEEFSGDIKHISLGREKLSAKIIDRARKELVPFGIELIDVQLRRIAYEKSVESKVYERMISERNRIAEKIRSIGKGEDAKINGKLNRDLKGIESKAYRKAQVIKGKGQAQAIAIYAASLGRDPSYYEFTRTLEAYKKTIPGRAQLILSSDSEFLKLLKSKK